MGESRPYNQHNITTYNDCLLRKTIFRAHLDIVTIIFDYYVSDSVNIVLFIMSPLVKRPTYSITSLPKRGSLLLLYYYGSVHYSLQCFHLQYKVILLHHFRPTVGERKKVRRTQQRWEGYVVKEVGLLNKTHMDVCTVQGRHVLKY